MMIMELLWNPNPLGTPLSAPIIIVMPQPCPGILCPESSELIGIKYITSSIGFPLAYLAKK
jgi:hypothetical protein